MTALKYLSQIENANQSVGRIIEMPKLKSHNANLKRLNIGYINTRIVCILGDACWSNAMHPRKTIQMFENESIFWIYYYTHEDVVYVTYSTPLRNSACNALHFSILPYLQRYVCTCLVVFPYVTAPASIRICLRGGNSICATKPRHPIGQ